MLKKFTEFTNESTDSNVSKPAVEKTDKKIAKVIPPKIKEPKKEEVKEPITSEPKMETFEFIGKIVQFPKEVKPSISLVLLENNNISKDKLHYVISQQTEDTLVVFKYNETVDMKLTEFVNAIITHYKTNEKVKHIFEKISVEGSNQFSLIKNIPDLKIGEKKLIQVLNENLVKLLK